MQSSFDINSLTANPTNPSNNSGELLVHLLQQILETQRQQLAQMQATAAAHDAGARWRNLVARWKEEFPELPQSCKKALPILEKAYGSIISSMIEELQDNDEDALYNEFTLQDFIDRYGMRIGQLGNILNLVGPLAEVGSQNESPKGESS